VTAAALTSPDAAARTATTVRADDAGALIDLLPAEGALSWVRRRFDGDSPEPGRPRPLGGRGPAVLEGGDA